MDPDKINCMILRIHVDKIIITIPSHAIQRRTSVSARYGSKKKVNVGMCLIASSSQALIQFWKKYNECQIENKLFSMDIFQKILRVFLLNRFCYHLQRRWFDVNLNDIWHAPLIMQCSEHKNRPYAYGIALPVNQHPRRMVRAVLQHVKAEFVRSQAMLGGNKANKNISKVSQVHHLGKLKKL